MEVGPMSGLDAPEDRDLEKEEFLGAASLFTMCSNQGS